MFSKSSKVCDVKIPSCLGLVLLTQQGDWGSLGSRHAWEHSKMYSSHWQGPAASPWSRTTKQQGLQHIPLFQLLGACFFLGAPSRGSFSHPHTLQNFCSLSSFLSFCSFVKTASLQIFQSFAKASPRHKAVLWIAALVVSSQWLRVRWMCVGAHDALGPK